MANPILKDDAQGENIEGVNCDIMFVQINSLKL